MRVLEAKYLALFRLGIRRMTEYKVNFFGRFARLPVELLMFYFVWKIIFEASGAAELGGMSFEIFIVYAMMTRFLFISMPNQRITWEIEDAISSGSLSYTLTKPFGFMRYMFFNYSSEFFIYGIATTALFVIFSAITGWYILSSPLYWALFLVSYILSIMLNFFMYFSIGMITFWTEGIWGVIRTVSILRAFLSGEMLPLTLFPLGFQAVLSYLPFKYLLFTSMFTYLQKYTVQQALLQIGFQAAWIAAFMLLIMMTISKGLKKFNSQGG